MYNKLIYGFFAITALTLNEISSLSAKEVALKTTNEISIPQHFKVVRNWGYGPSHFKDEDGKVFAENYGVNYRNILFEKLGDSILLREISTLWTYILTSGEPIFLFGTEDKPLGYLRVYNTSFTQLFKPVYTIAYSNTNVPLVETKYPFGSDSFKTFDVSKNNTSYFLKADKDLWGDFNISILSKCKISSDFLLSLVYVHTNKDMFFNPYRNTFVYGRITMERLLGLLELNNLEISNTIYLTKSIEMTSDYSTLDDNERVWIELEEQLNDFSDALVVDQDEKEQIILDLSQKYQDEEENAMPFKILSNLDSLSIKEKAVLFELIKQKKKFNQ